MTEALAMKLGWMLVGAFWTLVAVLAIVAAAYAYVSAKEWIRTRGWW